MTSLRELRSVLDNLDSSSFVTPSAQQLVARALAGSTLQSSQLRHIKKIGEGAFAAVDLIEVRGSQPPSSNESSPRELLERTPRASPRSFGRVLKGSLDRLRYSAGSNPESGQSPCSEVLVLKHAHKFEALELSSLTTGERELIPRPESEQINLVAESLLLQAIDHECIVRCFGAVQTTDPATRLPTIAIVQEFVSGGTLQGKINAGGYAPEAALIWLIDIASALRYLHEELEMPIAHRDLKPENILLTADGRAKLCDFGLFRFMDEPGKLDGKPRGQLRALPAGRKPLRHAIQTGKAGSYRYLAPENYHGRRYSSRVDVFSFAILACETLSRKRAYAEHYLTGEQIADGVANRGLRPALPASWSALLKSLFQRMWAEDPAARPPFSTIVAELEAIRTSGSISERRKRKGFLQQFKTRSRPGK
jgi:serine/threonine protein kinase